MKRFIILIISVIVADLLFQQCANPMSPKGGPKDTIPPTLLRVIPETGTTNFNEQTITLEFDEYINADKLKQNLVITPRSKFTYKHQIKKKQLILKFDEPFEDSTTYSLNFFDGVTDITERNPVVNLYIAFSTGSFIDSMKVNGTVEDLFSQEKQKSYTVGLYPISDSLDFLKDNPTYFTTTDESGNYELNYIKSAKYKITAFDDENRNLLIDPETESHGFLSDTINLNSVDSNSYALRTQLLNVKPIKFINARPVAQYIEAKYSREVGEYSITPDSVLSILVGDKKDVIRIYNDNQFNFGDSIQMILNANDSLGNNTIDTIKTVFQESSRKLPTFSSSIITKENQELKNDQKITLSFNKPIVSVDTSKFAFIKDSTFNYPIVPKLEWNDKMNEVIIHSNVNRDSVFAKLQRSLPKDTTKAKVSEEVAQGKGIDTPEILNTTLSFQMEKGAFISIENDTTKIDKLIFKTLTKESFGTLNINLDTEYNSFTLQLLSNKKIIYQSKDIKKITFPKVKPGNYSIRILIDNNNDGTWSNGNILKNEEPEGVFLYPEEISVRENWVIDIPPFSF